MISPTACTKGAVASRQVASLTGRFASSSRYAVTSQCSVGLRTQVLRYKCRGNARCFSTTPANALKDVFPAKETHLIKTTPPAWPHPGYTMAEMTAVVPAHRQPRTLSDKVAYKAVKFARFWMDKATGMDREQQVDKKNPTTDVVASKPLTEAQWVRLSLAQKKFNHLRNLLTLLIL